MIAGQRRYRRRVAATNTVLRMAVAALGPAIRDEVTTAVGLISARQRSNRPVVSARSEDVRIVARARSPPAVFRFLRRDTTFPAVLARIAEFLSPPDQTPDRKQPR